MKFPLHLIIEYAHTKPAEIDRALSELFGNGPLPKDLTSEDEDLLQGLFGEWLIYDYRQTNGSAFIAEFILTQTGHVSDTIIDQFTQIAKSNYYSEFEILSVVPGKIMVVEDIYTGHTYEIHDELGSQNVSPGSSGRIRIAQVNQTWYAVGANPVLLPLRYTDRLKKTLRNEIKPPHPTLKDTVELIRQPKAPPPPTLSQKELVKKRRDLKIQYETEAKKYGVSLTFEEMVQSIYHEDHVNPGDFWRVLMKKGITEEFMLKHFQILQDLWNYFPHRCLSGKSPYEAYEAMKRSKDR